MSSYTPVKVHFPWDSVKKHDGFFVPTLDVVTTIEQGTKAALHRKYISKVLVGVRGGRFGVLFIRTR